MIGAIPKYVLDCFALYAFFQTQTGGEKVKGLLDEARDQKALLFISSLNLAELYYIAHKKLGGVIAKSMLDDATKLPIHVESISDDQLFEAAEIKAHFNISFADSFAANLAKKLDATLVTGDPEFKALEGTITIYWLV